MHYIFDVDGTLTPSRGKIDQKFSNWFEHFQTHHATYMVTGSDKEKTIEQVGWNHYKSCIRVYNCSGNDVWESGSHVRTNKMTMPDKWESILGRILENSKSPVKKGNHFDLRPEVCLTSAPWVEMPHLKIEQSTKSLIRYTMRD